MRFVPVEQRAADPRRRDAAPLHGAHARRGDRAAPRTVPDFIVGAHALLQCSALITRDAGFFRDYFKGLKVIVPQPPERHPSCFDHPHNNRRTTACCKPTAQHVAERAALGIPPLPLSAQQTAEVDRAAEGAAGRRRGVPARAAHAPRAAGRRRCGEGQGEFLAAVAHGELRPAR